MWMHRDQHSLSTKYSFFFLCVWTSFQWTRSDIKKPVIDINPHSFLTILCRKSLWQKAQIIRPDATMRGLHSNLLTLLPGCRTLYDWAAYNPPHTKLGFPGFQSSMEAFLIVISCTWLLIYLMNPRSVSV